MMMRLGVSLGMRYWKEILIGAMFLMSIVFLFFFSWAIPQQQQPNIFIGPGGIAKVSPNVMRYEPIVAKYANAAGIGQYTQVLLAIMQQESGGNIPDVMQSSESLGLAPNTITDPTKSIEAGVNEFKSALTQAKGDLNIAVQSYNFGTAFVGFALSHGGYSHQVAAAFSIEMAHRMGWSSYGDMFYVDHVMRYVVNASLNAQVQKVLSIAQGYLSKKTSYVFGGGRSASEIAAGIFDCSSWVREVYFEAGIDLGPLTGTTTDVLGADGIAVSSAAQLQPGDLVFFNTYQPNGHVGIYLGNGQAIACNTGKGVSLIDMNSSYWKPLLSTTMRRIIH